MDAPDLLVVGAGPVGCVIAERAASVGWRSLVIDRRAHVAGNCHDAAHDGVLVHRYGPHYFRTDKQELIDYLSRFSAFHPADYIVRSEVGGRRYPMPINRRTLELFYGRPLTSEQAKALLESVREPIAEPRNAEEQALSKVGRALYEAFYEGYTVKQWGRHPRELDASVVGRLPVRYDDDERYVGHRFQVMPSAGFTSMFAKMLDHPLIETRLGVDYADVRGRITPKVATVYAGPVDEYFDHRLGRLPWRSLEFDFRTYERRFAQECVQINYPNEHEYTRTVEIKHVTKQEIDRTVVAYEYPRAQGDPYYPVPGPEGRALYAKYAELAAEERKKGVWFVGRLAEYRYINTDEAIERALSAFEEIRTEARRERTALTGRRSSRRGR